MNTNTLLGAGDFWVNLASLLIALLALSFGIWTYRKSRQRRLITYEFEDKNTNVVSVDRDKGENITILLDGQQVEEVRYQLIKIRNEGNIAVDSKDYKKPLQIAFVPQTTPNTCPLPQVILRAGITEAAPPLDISSHNAKDYIILDIQNQYVGLKDVLLNAGDWIKIKVLTLGKVSINVKGQIKDGQIKPFAPASSFLTWRRVVSSALFGALLFFLLYNSLGSITDIIQGNCIWGSIDVKGSSAFYSTASDFASSYHAACPIGFVNVDRDTSDSGLLDLKGGKIKIANSEKSGSTAGLNPANFEDHQAAVIVFTVAISKNVTGISSLSLDQLLGIYNGTYQNWKDVDSRAPDLPIQVFGRPATSGTYSTFTRYVLHTETHSAPNYQEKDRTDQMADAIAHPPQGYGAIGYIDEGTAGKMSSLITSVEIDQQAPTHALVENDTYHFWAIEHMYTKKNPDKLVTSFINYVIAHIETNDTIIKLQDMLPTSVQAHT